MKKLNAWVVDVVGRRDSLGKKPEVICNGEIHMAIGARIPELGIIILFVIEF